MLSFKEVAGWFEANKSKDFYHRDRVPFDAIPVVARMLSMIANDGGRTPLKLYVRAESGRAEIRPNVMGDKYERIAYAVRVKPAHDSDYFAAQRRLFDDLNRGVAFVAWDGVNLRVMPARRTYVERDPSTGLPLNYVVDYTQAEKAARSLSGGQVYRAEVYPAANVHRIIKEEDCDGEPVMLAKKFCQTFGFGELLHGYAVDFVTRGGVAKAYLGYDKPMTDEVATKAKRRIADWLFKRPEDKDDLSQGIGVVDGGLTLNTVSFDAQQMQLIEQRKEFRADVADIFTAPLAAVGLIEDYHYNSLAAARQDWTGQALEHLFCRVEAAYNAMLFDEVEQQYFYVEFDREALITYDALTLAQIDDIRLKGAPAMLVNESRARANQPAVPGGDSLMVAAGMQSAEYQRAKEALELERLRLEIEQLRGAAAPQPAPTEATPAPADESDADFLATMREAQASYVEQFRSALAAGDVSALIAEMVKVGWLYSASEGPALNRITERVIKAIAHELVSDHDPLAEYYCNRCLNAGIHEGIKHQHGVNAKAVWLGGEHNGKELGIDEVYEGKSKHPPLGRDADLRSFIRRKK